jgi:hypothetical protein
MIATNHPPKFLFEPINKSHSIVEVVYIYTLPGLF